MNDRRKEVETKLLYGTPEDFEPSTTEAKVAEVMILRTLYGSPFDNNYVCPLCEQRTSAPPGEPCTQCGRVLLSEEDPHGQR